MLVRPRPFSPQALVIENTTRAVPKPPEVSKLCQNMSKWEFGTERTGYENATKTPASPAPCTRFRTDRHHGRLDVRRPGERMASSRQGMPYSFKNNLSHCELNMCVCRVERRDAKRDPGTRGSRGYGRVGETDAVCILALPRSPSVLGLYM